MSAPTEQMFIGIDVSKATLDVATRGQSRTQQFANSEAGVDALVAGLKASLAASGASVAVILMEATGRLERLAASQLCLAGYAVMVVNPRQAHDFAKALGYLSKTDKTDAQALAQFGYTLSASPKREQLLLKLPSREQDLLAAMITRRSQLVGMRVAEGNRLASCHPTQRKSIVAVIKLFERQIQCLDDDIEGSLKDHFKAKLDLLKGMKGVGTATQATLMALLPELGALSAAEIAKLVGVAPLNRDSGTMRGKRSTFGGRADVRAVLYMASLSAMRYEPAIREFAERLKGAGKPAKVVIVACMHKMITIMNAIIKSGKPWQPGYGCPQPAHA